LKPVAFLDGRVNLFAGDCLDVLAGMPKNSVDSCVTDPPYHLTSIVKRYSTDKSNLEQPADKDLTRVNAGQYRRLAGGFMGQKWDGGDIAFRPETWAAVLRVMKPGAHLLAFSSTRTYHRMVCAIEDAGFEIRDSIFYCYGSGFPKSFNVNKKLRDEKECCSCDENLHGMRQRLDTSDTVSGRSQSDLQSGVFGSSNFIGEDRQASTQRPAHFADVSAMRNRVQDSPMLAEAECVGLLQQELPRQACDGAASGEARAQGARGLDRGEHGVIPDQNDRGEEPGMEGRSNASQATRELRLCSVRPMPAGVDGNVEAGRLCDGASPCCGEDGRPSPDSGGVRPSRRPRPAEQRTAQPGTVAGQQKPQTGGAWPLCDGCGKPIVLDGLGTALKPALEPICLARKPLSASGIAANVLRWGTGALNIDGCRVGISDDDRQAMTGRSGGTAEESRIFDGGIRGRAIGEVYEPPAAGRWPANLIHDGSEEVLEAFLETGPGQIGGINDPNGSFGYHGGAGGLSLPGVSDAGGSAARYFYSAKADSSDRIGSSHPTVKPLDLMQYLCRLITPPGGTVLDLFAGTGTTGEAAWREGFNAILIEREEEYQADIARRMDLAVKPAKRAAVAKTKGKLMGAEGTPLFGDAA
jgi:DNA modification methylase